MLLALATGSCGSDEKSDAVAPPGLRVDRYEGQRGPEVIVYVARPADNVPGMARGAPRVRLRCLDARRRVVVRRSHRWPFTDTDDGLVEAHVHQPIPRPKAARVRTCELLGTRKPLRGTVTNPTY